MSKNPSYHRDFGLPLEDKMVAVLDAAGWNNRSAPLDPPYDGTKAGDSWIFAAMVTPAGLAEIKTYADGIGPWKPYIVPVKGRLDAAGGLVDFNGDGKIDLRDASTQPATT
jgi:glycerophosphoryl diester phosphodiesterase